MPTARLRYIVSRDRPRLYQYLKQEFSAEATIDVILDRRTDGGPPPDGPAALERGEPDRRTRDVGASIRTAGWAIVWDRPPER